MKMALEPFITSSKYLSACLYNTFSTAGQQPEEHILSPSEDEHTTMSDVPTVTCTLCGAGYVPSPAHEDLKYAPEVVLESVLMRMCHFCFRCRRAACPECWDEVHGVCGSCVQEA